MDEFFFTLGGKTTKIKIIKVTLDNRERAQAQLSSLVYEVVTL